MSDWEPPATEQIELLREALCCGDIDGAVELFAAKLYRGPYHYIALDIFYDYYMNLLAANNKLSLPQLSNFSLLASVFIDEPKYTNVLDSIESMLEIANEQSEISM